MPRDARRQDQGGLPYPAYHLSMLLQATLNGPLAKDDHGAVPVTLEELAADALECVSAGARAFHVHPRDESGAESLQAQVVDRVVSAVREPHGMPVGVTTGEWIEPDLQRRLRLIREWTQTSMPCPWSAPSTTSLTRRT